MSLLLLYGARRAVNRAGLGIYLRFLPRGAGHPFLRAAVSLLRAGRTGHRFYTFKKSFDFYYCFCIDRILQKNLLNTCGFFQFVTML